MTLTTLPLWYTFVFVILIVLFMTNQGTKMDVLSFLCSEYSWDLGGPKTRDMEQLKIFTVTQDPQSVVSYYDGIGK